MSTKILRYTEIYHHLQESIDFEKAQAIPLRTGIRSEVEIEDLQVGVLIERYKKNQREFLGKGTVLYNDFDPDNYYNLGFDIEGVTPQIYKKDYRSLAKILGVVVKSTLEWIKGNDPTVLTVFADGDNSREKRKKLSIYGSILQGNTGLLEALGYDWGRGLFTVNPGRYQTKQDLLFIKKVRQ